MGFFERNRRDLQKRGMDPGRLPPGQYFTERFPVLHAGSVPVYKDLSNWDFTITGQVAREVTLSWADIVALPAVEVTTDIHCVTKWSRFDTVWRGVPVSEVLKLVEADPAADHLMCHSEFGFTSNLPLADVTGDHVALLAYEHGGRPLEPEHGYPLRFLVPHLYFWKSAKWLRGLELMVGDRPGFWEANGYHSHGDPWKEQRFSQA